MLTSVSTKLQSDPVKGSSVVEEPIDALPFEHPAGLVAKKPYFSSRYGSAYLGDSLRCCGVTSRQRKSSGDLSSIRSPF